MATTQEILNTILNNATAEYKARIPVATASNLQEVGKAIQEDTHLRNEFINAIINKVAFSVIKSKMFKNPLSALKTNTGRPMGHIVEEIFVNPVADGEYQKEQNVLLKSHNADGKTAYYGMNRKGQYPVTINEDLITSAFTSDAAFHKFYNSIVTALYSGDSIDEFLLMKGVVSKAVQNGHVEKINVHGLDPKAIAKSISNISKQFQFPNTTFAPYNKINADSIAKGEKAVTTFTPKENQVLLVRSDLLTDINYDVLATMFQRDVLDFEKMCIEIDSFMSELNIKAILCDKESIQVIDKLFKTTTFFNDATLDTNIYLHHWQWLFLSTFANVVAFVDEE